MLSLKRCTTLPEMYCFTPSIPKLLTPCWVLAKRFLLFAFCFLLFAPGRGVDDIVCGGRQDKPFLPVLSKAVSSS